jgi:hypothetical protein
MKSKVIVILAGALVIGAGLTFFLKKPSANPSPATLSPSTTKGEAISLREKPERLKELQEEFMALIRNEKNRPPEEQRAAIEAWRQAHQEEMGALRRAQGERLRQETVSRPFAAQPAPEGLPPEQKKRWDDRQQLMVRQHQLSVLEAQPGSPERDQKIAQLRTELDAEYQKRRTRMEEEAKQREAALTPEEKARRAELNKLFRQRTDYMMSLKDMTPEERRKAIETWEKEHPQLRELLRAPTPSKAN